MSSFVNLFILGLTLSLSFGASAHLCSWSDDFKYHSVKGNETIFSIAKEHAVTPEDIYRYNPTSRKGIKIGEVLQIPEKSHSTNSQTNSKTLTHQVLKGESLYFIAKKYNCSQEDILNLNPGISVIKKGMSLTVPNPAYQIEKNSKANCFEYRIQSGDTYYNLNKRFGSDKESLEKINPNLKDGIKAGMIIFIPKNSQPSKPGIPGNAEKMTAKGMASLIEEQGKRKDHIFNIGLYLPFCYDLNDSVKIAPHSANYLEFYEGAMIAAENLAAAGLKFKMYVYDTNQDPKVVDQLVKKQEFLSLDLIIGPVYPNCQNTISALSAKNRIPMVSPLSPDSHLASANPYYFQVNPDRNLRLSGTADYICQKYKGRNLIFLGNQDGSSESKLIPGKLKLKKTNNIVEYDLWADSKSGIESVLNPEEENVIILTDNDEARVSVAITRLNTISRKFRITLIGMQEYTRMKSINIEYLHNLKLHYLSPYYIDFNNKDVKNFITTFRNYYSAEPSQYAYQGYDILTAFLKNLEKSGRKFTVQGPEFNLHLLQSEYNFQRVSNFGGFVNSTFFIIEYSDTYDVRCSGKINTSF
jgi:LysM repeat protein/ABC-type branched-subunit amino acid transport system substrate-binding protein